jgi:predicted metal-dependent HD superfamily phosphohydrolase
MRQEWMQLAREHGAAPEVAERWWRDLAARYSEPQRHYHTMQHVAEILPLVSTSSARAAVWFHDAIYDPRGTDNEERSAVLARDALHDLRFDQATIDSVAAAIRATAHHDPAGLPPDLVRFLDSDLSILGADRERYRAYTAAVRREYAHVPDAIFRPARRAILQSFAARPRIYFTDELRDRFEAAARANLAREIEELA